MILYRKTQPLRIRRSDFPEPPFWYATAIAPYSPRRAHPVAIDYLSLQASSGERLEVNICADVGDELERLSARQPVRPPALIEATEFAEAVFRRGSEALSFCATVGAPAIHLVSTRGALPDEVPEGSVIATACWPLEFPRLTQLFAEAKRRSLPWGVVIPVIYPVTTHLGALEDLASDAAEHGASFFAPLPVELEATAKHAVAASLAAEGEDEVYTMLFHADLEPLHVATERHIAALAAERGLADFVTPPQWNEKSNWNAAALLTLTASRMFGMREEVELAGSLARAARVVASLDKPLTRIAEAASLAIVEGLDEVTIDILGDWMNSGESAFVSRVNAKWRLRRDVGM